MTIPEIIKKAEEIARLYNPDGLSPFPFDKIILDKTDLQIIHSDKLNDKISGAIVFDEDKNKFFVFVNTKKPQTRQYFTLAHELGHYFLHISIIKDNGIIVDEENILDGNSALFRMDEPRSNQQIEREANNFAAALIMPEQFVRKVWDKLKNVEECANIFNVSILAMSIRLEKLGLVE